MKTIRIMLVLCLAFSLFFCCALPASAEAEMSYKISYGSKYTYLTLSPSRAENVIRFTSDGSVPDASSREYTGRLRAASPVMIRAAEFNKNGEKISGLKITLRRKCRAVEIAEKSTDGGFLISLSSPTDGCDIFFTTDGSKPNSKSNVYQEPFFAEAGTVIRAYAAKEGWKNSASCKVTVGKAQKKAADAQESTADETCEKVLERINDYRAENGLEPLTLDETLMKAAQTRGEELISSYSHTRPDGTKWHTVLSEVSFSYRSAGENIAWNEGTLRTAKFTVNAWIDSPGHRANILGDYEITGICCVHSGGKAYWVQLFAKKQ